MFRDSVKLLTGLRNRLAGWGFYWHPSGPWELPAPASPGSRLQERRFGASEAQVRQLWQLGEEPKHDERLLDLKLRSGVQTGQDAYCLAMWAT